MSDTDEILPSQELDAETERFVYKITEGIQRLNSIGAVQFIQIDLGPLPDEIIEKLRTKFNSPLEDGFYVNQTIVLEQMDTGDSFMRVLNAIRNLYLLDKSIGIEGIYSVVNFDYRGEPMDIIISYDPVEHDISLVSVSQKEEFFKILEYVRFFWLKSRPRI